MAFKLLCVLSVLCLALLCQSRKDDADMDDAKVMRKMEMIRNRQRQLGRSDSSMPMVEDENLQTSDNMKYENMRNKNKMITDDWDKEINEETLDQFEEYNQKNRNEMVRRINNQNYLNNLKQNDQESKQQENSQELKIENQSHQNQKKQNSDRTQSRRQQNRYDIQNQNRQGYTDFNQHDAEDWSNDSQQNSEESQTQNKQNRYNQNESSSEENQNRQQSRYQRNHRFQTIENMRKGSDQIESSISSSSKSQEEGQNMRKNNKIKMVSSDETDDASPEVKKSVRVFHNTNPQKAGNAVQKSNHIKLRHSSNTFDNMNNDDVINKIFKGTN